MSAAIEKTLRAARGYLMSKLKDLTDEQWTTVPTGSSNNILWNVGHLLHSHNGMTYGRCGLDPQLPENYADLFKGGTSPSDWPETPDVADVRDRFAGQLDRIFSDYQAGKFENFDSFELMPGYKIDTVEDVLAFLIFHESLHVEAVVYLRKGLGA